MLELPVIRRSKSFVPPSGSAGESLRDKIGSLRFAAKIARK
jgi:hypothetical protein